MQSGYRRGTETLDPLIRKKRYLPNSRNFNLFNRLSGDYKTNRLNGVFQHKLLLRGSRIQFYLKDGLLMLLIVTMTGNQFRTKRFFPDTVLVKIDQGAQVDIKYRQRPGYNEKPFQINVHNP